jgi:hypothetical protein
MRLTILFTAAALALAACTPPAEAPAEKAPAAQAAVPEPVMPADAPPQEDVIAPVEANATSCTLDQGSDAAVALASRCTRVSPASHPPCNPENPCQLIQDEIDRACAQYPAGQKPAECAA